MESPWKALGDEAFCLDEDGKLLCKHGRVWIEGKIYFKSFLSIFLIFVLIFQENLEKTYENFLKLDNFVY